MPDVLLKYNGRLHYIHALASRAVVHIHAAWHSVRDAPRCEQGSQQARSGRCSQLRVRLRQLRLKVVALALELLVLGLESLERIDGQAGGALMRGEAALLEHTELPPIKFAARGVELRAGVRVAQLVPSASAKRIEALELSDGSRIEADEVLSI